MSVTVVCIHGHDLTGDNLYVNPHGRRYCRACGRANWHRHHGKDHKRPPIFDLVARLKRDGVLHLHWDHFGGRYAWTVLQYRWTSVCRDDARCLILKVTDTGG